MAFRMGVDSRNTRGDCTFICRQIIKSSNFVLTYIWWSLNFCNFRCYGVFQFIVWTCGVCGGNNIAVWSGSTLVATNILFMSIAHISIQSNFSIWFHLISTPQKKQIHESVRKHEERVNIFIWDTHLENLSKCLFFLFYMKWSFHVKSLGNWFLCATANIICLS